MFAYGSAKIYFVNNLRTAKDFLKHAALPKRVWQGHNTSVGREDLSQCWQARPYGPLFFLHNFHLDSSEVV